MTFWISQGTVATVYMRGGQIYKQSVSLDPVIQLVIHLSLARGRSVLYPVYKLCVLVYQCVERKGKEEYLYSAFSHQGTYKALRHGSHSFTCKQHHACFSFVAFTRCHHHNN